MRDMSNTRKQIAARLGMAAHPGAKAKMARISGSSFVTDSGQEFEIVRWQNLSAAPPSVKETVERAAMVTDNKGKQWELLIRKNGSFLLRVPTAGGKTIEGKMTASRPGAKAKFAAEWMQHVSNMLRDLTNERQRVQVWIAGPTTIKVAGMWMAYTRYGKGAAIASRMAYYLTQAAGTPGKYSGQDIKDSPRKGTNTTIWTVSNVPEEAVAYLKAWGIGTSPKAFAGFTGESAVAYARPGAKARFGTEVGRKGNKAAMITRDGTGTWYAYVVQRGETGIGPFEEMLGTMRSYATEEKAKRAAIKALDTSGFSRPGAKASFAQDARAVAQEILRQLGGGRFMAMVGGKNAMHGTFSGKPGLQVSIGKGAEGGINRLIVTLDPATDTYDMEFWRIGNRGLSTKKVSEASMVYADDLQRVFTDRTKFYTSMSRPGAKAAFAAPGIVVKEDAQYIYYYPEEDDRATFADDDGKGAYTVKSNRTGKPVSTKTYRSWEEAVRASNAINEKLPPLKKRKAAMSRPGAKAKMDKNAAYIEYANLRETTSKLENRIARAPANDKPRLMAELAKQVQRMKELSQILRASRPGAKVTAEKATMAAHPENIAWMRSLPAPVVAKVREILTKPHSGARAKALRDALKSGGVSYNKWIPDASAGAEVLGHQFQEAFAKPSDLEREDVKAGLKLMEKADKAVSDKIRTLIAEGKPQDQAVAIALDMKRRGEI